MSDVAGMVETIERLAMEVGTLKQQFATIASAINIGNRKGGARNRTVQDNWRDILEALVTLSPGRVWELKGERDRARELARDLQSQIDLLRSEHDELRKRYVDVCDSLGQRIDEATAANSCHPADTRERAPAGATESDDDDAPTGDEASSRCEECKTSPVDADCGVYCRPCLDKIPF